MSRFWNVHPLCHAALCVALAALLLSSAIAAAGGPRSQPPAPVAATWDATHGLLVLTFDRPLSVSAWPPLPIENVFAVSAGAQQWRTALTVEIGGDATAPNRQLWIVFGDPVPADPPADGATCGYSGDFLTGISGARVAPFDDFPCDQ